MSSKHQSGIVTGNGARTEQALRASELSYRRLFEAALDGILILDVDTGRISDVNPFLIKLLGFSHGEMVGKTVGELSPFKDIVSNQAMLERLQKDGHVRYHDLPLETKDGRKIAVEFVSNVYQAGDKKVIQCNVRDITGRRPAEETLRKSEERYRGLFEHMVEGFAYCRMIFENGEPKDWIYLSVNHVFEDLTGLKGVAGKRVSVVIPRIAETDPELFKIYARVSLTGKAEQFEMFVQALQEWFAISVYSPEKEFFVAVFDVITTRKQVEAALRESERRFQMLADTSPVGIFHTNAQGQTIYVNPRWCQITGLSATDALGDGWLRAVHPEDRGKLVQAWQAATQEQGASKVDYRFVHTDGAISWVMGQAVPEKDDAGRIVGYVGTITDITERKRAEIASTRLAAIVEYSDDAIIGKSPDGIITSWNKGAEKIFGFSADEMVGNSIMRLIPADRPDEENRILEKINRGESVEHFETLRRTRDGRLIDVSITASPIMDNAGRIIGVSKMERDITARKRLEAALNRERDLWQTMLDNWPDHIYFKDTQSRFIKVSKALARRVGLESPDEMLGKTDFDFFDEAHARPAFEDEQEIIRTGQPMIAKEEREVWMDGHVTWASTTKMPLRDETGKIVGIMGISRDITKQRQLEEQFRQAQKMEAVGQLAGGVAHDFNNILGVIMGYGDLITEDLEPDSPLQKYAEEIRHAAVRAAGLTRQLLVFSRKQQVQPVVLDLNDAVKDLDKMLRRLIGENIEMAVVPGKEIGRIKADPGYIGQVLMNLAVNARDAMPNGGKLTIATNNVTLDANYTRTHTGVIPGDYVMLTVSDTGTGMTPEVKARMFEALFTTKPSGKGTGLGLATCQTIVQQSGGHIDVDSEVGKGTTFKIYFPRVDKALAVAAGSGQTGSGQNGPLPRGTETLLLVEDEASVRHLAWKVLESLGYRVLRANNGQEGLRVARECKGQPVHLVITDVIMPQMNGKVMAEWLKSTYPEIKVLFTSGYTDDAISQHGVLEPGVAFLPKPYTTATLARKVRAMLDNETDTAFLRKNSGEPLNEIPPVSA